MGTKIREFIKHLDHAVGVAEQRRKVEQPDSPLTKQLDGLIWMLNKIRSDATAGKLYPSGGSLTLGVAREVADWGEPWESPLLKAVGAVERYYRDKLKTL